MTGAAHGLHRGNACWIKHQTIILMFAATATKAFMNRFTTVVLFRRRAAMSISPRALLLRNTVPGGS
jgi:hypothetical protein